MKEHWNKVYAGNPIENLGWYEENPAPSIELVKRSGVNRDSKIVDIGSGASTFIDYLIDNGFTKITALDISAEALTALETRLGVDKSCCVNFLTADITDEKVIEKLEKYDLWHDRTLLHFLIQPDQREKYLAALRNALNINGYAIIAVFSIGGANKCSGLAVKNFDHKMLMEFLGSDFKLEHHFYHKYIQPSGNARPFVYTLFKRVK